MVAVAVTRGLSFFEPHRLRQTCRICRREECQGLREAWGCDAPTEQPQLWIPCVACDGQNETCSTCSGAGYEAIHRCPRIFITEEAKEYLELYEEFPRALPLSGGLYDQPERYLICMRIIGQAVARLEREESQRAERKATPNA